MELNRVIKQFERLNLAMDVLLNEESSNKVRIVVCSGTAGVGKSKTVLDRLEAEHKKANINLVTVEGSTTPINLYMKLYEARHECSVLVIDDSDRILKTRDGLELLKHATETSRRVVQYNTQSTILKNKNIPNEFEFNGKVIVLSNIDFAKEMDTNRTLGEHYKAVMSRGVYVDLVFKSKMDVIAYIEYVLKTTHMLQMQGLTVNEEKEIMQFMRDHVDDLITVTLRTPSMIASIFLTNTTNWKENAKSLLCVGY